MSQTEFNRDDRLLFNKLSDGMTRVTDPQRRRLVTRTKALGTFLSYKEKGSQITDFTNNNEDDPSVMCSPSSFN